MSPTFVEDKIAQEIATQTARAKRRMFLGSLRREFFPTLGFWAIFAMIAEPFLCGHLRMIILPASVVILILLWALFWAWYQQRASERKMIRDLGRQVGLVQQRRESIQAFRKRIRLQIDLNIAEVKP